MLLNTFNARTTPVLALVMAIPLVAQQLTGITLPVSAHMDIYQAGGYSDGSGGVSPAVYTFSAAPGQTITFPSVTGSWTCNYGVAMYGPDGTTTGRCDNLFNISPTGPFSGYESTDFQGALAGMFLEDTLPVSAPPSLRFYVGNSSQGGMQTNFRTLAPEIGQVFFIGDGLTGTGTGAVQLFAVPPAATHLYLGYVDACNDTTPGCYSDNAGSLTATFQLEEHKLNWVEPALSTAPPPRCCMGFAFDYATDSTVMFGGFTNPTTLGDTWILREQWTQLFPAASPSPRVGPAMAWDGAAGDIVLFGGADADGTSLDDTWTWDGVTWTQQFPPVSPSPRQFLSGGMAYDKATRTVLLFGGLNSSHGTLGDTWTWDGVAKTWTQQFPASSPSPRRAPIAYDDKSRTVVLFGGDNNGGGIQYTDTWTWDGKTWRQRFPAASPSARTNANMAYDGALGVVVLFGGFAGSWPESLDDTWIWDGIDWTKDNPATVPPNRYSAGMTYVPATAYGVLMFGGFSSGPGRSDTWLFTVVPH